MISSSIFLSLTQIISLVVPLLVYPYLYSIYGINGMGDIISTFIILDTVLLISMYGFDITSYREVSRSVGDKRKIGSVLSNVIFTRSFICVLSYLIIAISQNWKPIESLTYFVYLLFGALVNPWFFVAVERVKSLCAVTLLSKLIFLLFVFNLIDIDSDKQMYFYALTLEKMIIATALFGVFLSDGYKFILVSFKNIITTLREEFSFFVSRAAVTLYMRSNTLALGVVGSLSGVAVFDFSNKLLSAMKIPSNVITQVLYTRMAKKYDSLLVIKVAVIIVISSVVGLTVLFSILEFVIFFLTKGELSEYKYFIIFLLASFPISALSSFIGTCVLNANDENRLFKLSVFIPTGLFFTTLGVFFIIDIIDLNNVSILFFSTEVLVLMFRLVFSIRYLYVDKTTS